MTKPQEQAFLDLLERGVFLIGVVLKKSTNSEDLIVNLSKWRMEVEAEINYHRFDKSR